jgi:hypothetical protein
MKSIATIILSVPFILSLQTVNAQFVVFNSFDDSGPYFALPAGSGVLGVEDYVMDLASTGLPPGTSTVNMTDFRFVGGATSTDGLAGIVINVDFADAGSTSQQNFNLALPAEGNFIWTVSAPVTIPTTGFVTITLPPDLPDNTGRGVEGQWFVVEEGAASTVGSSPLDPFGLGIVDTQPGVFTLTISTDSELPVELISFEGVASGRDVVLKWKTASEQNNAGFFIERRMGENLFAELGFVEGAGNSTDELTYRYTASDLPYGTHAFRIRQVDFDGTTAFSPEIEVAVTLPYSHDVSLPYPNPTTGSANLELAGADEQQVGVSLYDVRGTLVRDAFDGLLEANLTRKIHVDFSGLPSGTYILRIQGRTFTETRRVVVIR